MRFITGSNHPSIRCRLGLSCLMLGMITCAVIASGQQRGETSLAGRIQSRVKISDEQGFVHAQLQKLPGVVLAEGSNSQPVGQYHVTTYRIEEVSPAAPLQAEVDGKSVLLDKVWRIAVIGGPFPVRNAPAVIWIDDEPVGFGAESPDLRSISTLVFDRSVLKHGARLALSYGVDHNGRSVLPESINLARTR